MLQFVKYNRALAIGRRGLAAVVAAAWITACASSGAAGGKAASQPHSSRDVLTQDDLARVKADNLYDAIQKLRPEFLRGDQAGIFGQTDATGAKVSGSIPAGASTSATVLADPVVPVSVFRNNVKLNGPDDLKQIMISDVKEVRYLKGPQASIRYGMENSSGAILITSK